MGKMMKTPLIFADMAKITMPNEHGFEVHGSSCARTMALTINNHVATCIGNGLDASISVFTIPNNNLLLLWL
jgi:nicotinamidase-related amidase